jgi:hypothetical protein
MSEGADDVPLSDPHSIALSSNNICSSRYPTRCICLFFVLSKHPCDIQLYQSAKGVTSIYDALVDILESIEKVLNRLDIYTKLPLTVAMTELVVKILVELLSTLALVTKQIEQGRFSESVFV